MVVWLDLMKIARLGEWFDVPTDEYMEYSKGRVELNIEGASKAEILSCFWWKPY